MKDISCVVGGPSFGTSYGASRIVQLLSIKVVSFRVISSYLLTFNIKFSTGLPVDGGRGVLIHFAIHIYALSISRSKPFWLEKLSDKAC
jgi:hypothetical protein